MAVQPGDILHGDENGLIAVPAVPQDELRAAVEQVRTVERKLMDYVRGPEFALAELAKRFFE
jgi:regulator of RNase E activity RraA